MGWRWLIRQQDRTRQAVGRRMGHGQAPRFRRGQAGQARKTEGGQVNPAAYCHTLQDQWGHLPFLSLPPVANDSEEKEASGGGRRGSRECSLYTPLVLAENGAGASAPECPWQLLRGGLLRHPLGEHHPSPAPSFPQASPLGARLHGQWC